MGLETRDYYRSEPPTDAWDTGPSGGFSAVTWLIIITGGVYIMQLLLGEGFTAWLDLDPAAVLHGELWRLCTYDFLHSRESPWHILWNMYILYVTGRNFEQRRGAREFVAFYLLAGVLSGVLFVLWSLGLGHVNPAIGASGAVVAVMIVYALTYPRQIWYFFGVIPIPIWVIAGLTVIFDLHPMLLELSGEHVADGVAHSAHMGGIVFGALYWKQNWRVTAWLPSAGRRGWKQWFQRRPRLKIHRESEPVRDGRFDRRVDELLDKVAREGEASLTAEERSILIEASRRARNRLSR